MKIYSIKDRLIEWFQPPFIAENDKAVQSTLAQVINGATEHAICQAPHHFEIWSLGHVTEDGHIIPEREFIADCASLVRAGIREGREPGAAEAPITPQKSRGDAGREHESTGTKTSPVPDQARPKASTAANTHIAPEGSHQRAYD